MNMYIHVYIYICIQYPISNMENTYNLLEDRPHPTPCRGWEGDHGVGWAGVGWGNPLWVHMYIYIIYIYIYIYIIYLYCLLPIACCLVSDADLLDKLCRLSAADLIDKY